jgi:hypothetical protein
MTAVIGATIIDTLLQGRPKEVGFQSPVKVVGVHRMRSELEAEGVFGQTSVLF